MALFTSFFGWLFSEVAQLDFFDRFEEATSRGDRVLRAASWLET